MLKKDFTNLAKTIEFQKERFTVEVVRQVSTVAILRILIDESLVKYIIFLLSCNICERKK